MSTFNSTALFGENPSLDSSPFSRSGGAGFDGAFLSRSQSSTESLNGIWDSAGRMTFSFASDATSISDYKSSLFESFSYLMNEEQLKQTIGDAFQSWAGNSSINFGQVADGGQPFGTSGLNQGDLRFGDIRIGSIPLDDSVLAVAAPFDLAASGTWSGDILFNSRAKFRNRQQFQSVAMHEIGHVLGLQHSDGLNDVMNPATFNSVLSGNDISSLQIDYGVRAVDQYDSEGDQNNTLDDATRIRLAGSDKGDVPLIAFGDISNSGDVDFYEARIFSGYQGDVSFRVVSKGISLLAPEITVFDENGDEISHQRSTSISGDDLTFTFSPTDDRLFVRIAGSSVDGTRNIGSYGLVTLFESDVQYDPVYLDSVLRKDLWRLDQHDVHSLFLNAQPVFNDDLHTNDSFLTATPLEPVLSAPLEDQFLVQAGIIDATDLDFFRFTAPGNSGEVLTATLTSMEHMGLIGNLKFYDSRQQLLQHSVVTRGNGRLVVQLEKVIPGDEYVVAVQADRPAIAFDTGNFTLGMTFRRSVYDIQTFAEGSLSIHKPQNIHTLFVAETQLFNFGLTAVPKWLLSNDVDQQKNQPEIWMTVYREDGTTVHRAPTRLNDFRSTRSIVLQPGTYSIRTHLRFQDGAPGSNVPIEYSIQGNNVTDPMGPELLTPGNTPFPKCGPTSSDYCYPGDRVTPSPFLIIAGNETKLPPGATDPPPFQDVDLWYWYQNWTDDSIG